MADFGGARKWARALIEENVPSGATVVDATMGNGYDTLWLTELVGDKGRVYAFDIQKEALERTCERLKENHLEGRATLIKSGHETMNEYVSEPIDAAVFNLGWLPGTPHECTTRVETTLKAVNQALNLLKSGGILTVCVYPGHEEGLCEREALTKWAENLDDGIYDAVIFRYANIRKLPPLLIAVTRRK